MSYFVLYMSYFLHFDIFHVLPISKDECPNPLDHLFQCLPALTLRIVFLQVFSCNFYLFPLIPLSISRRDQVCFLSRSLLGSQRQQLNIPWTSDLSPSSLSSTFRALTGYGSGGSPSPVPLRDLLEYSLSLSNTVTILMPLFNGRNI